MNKNSTANKIQDLVSKGKLGEAIEFLIGDLEDRTEISILSGRYKELRRKNRLNVIGEDEANIQRNRIQESVLALTKENYKNKVKVNLPLPHKTIYTIIIAATLFAFCIVLALIIMQYNSNFKEIPSDVPSGKPNQEYYEDKPDNRGEIIPPHEKFKKPKNPIPNSKILNEIIKYKGKPIENAYFKIEGYKSCNSSISNDRGEVRAEIPITLYKSDNMFHFLIYQNDELLYSKKMRFENLDLNKY